MEYISPTKVHVRVDKVDTKDIPVDVNVAGTPADGCRAGKPSSPVSTITVQGPAAELANVAKAVAVIDVTGAESTLTNIECPVTLYDRDGTAVASQHITSKTEKIKVTVPMYNIDTLPLTVTLKDGGKLTAQQVKYSISPESVKVVTSDQASLGDLRELNLGEIDLGSVRTGVPIELSIRDKLPEGVLRPAVDDPIDRAGRETDGDERRDGQAQGKGLCQAGCARQDVRPPSASASLRLTRSAYTCRTITIKTARANRMSRPCISICAPPVSMPPT